MCASLQSLLRMIFFFTFFQSWSTEIEIDSLDAYPKDDL